MLVQSLRLFRLSMQNKKGVTKYFIITLFFELLSILGLYFLNKQYGFLYQGIQDYNTPLIWRSIWTFCGIAGLLVISGGLVTFYMNKLAFAIRTGLTNFFLAKMFLGAIKPLDNLEQRIQEDLRNFGERSCEFWFTIIRSGLKIPVFLGVVIQLTSLSTGLILLAAIVGGTVFTKLVSKKLIILQAEQECNEAKFRKTLTNPVVKEVIQGYAHIVSLFLLINKQIKKLSFVQSGLSQAFVLLPFIILLPLYIAKTITLGVFMQSVNALSKVIDSLTVLIDNRQLIVNISTCLKRIEVLEKAQK